MDFSLNEEQLALQELSRQILGGRLTHDRLRQVEGTDDRFDRETWAELAKANLLGVALPDDVGGSGLGFLGACVLLEEVGRTVAPLPVLPTVVMGALPIAELGTPAQRERLLPPVIAGEAVLTAALVEAGGDAVQPATTATADGDGWRLDGVKICVPAGMLAAHVLVAARTSDDAVGVFI